jgi:hypothetical protein
MLSTFMFNICIAGEEYQILVSPLSLHSKEQPDIKPGKINKLYFYNQLKNDAYKAKIQQLAIQEQFKSDRFIINYGQDFEKYYLGSFYVDVEAKRFWQWEGNSTKFREKDVEFLADFLFNPDFDSQPVILFTPTLPSDINLAVGPDNF